MFKLEYPLKLSTDDVDGGYVVAFPDFPEVNTQGETIEEALLQAEDALDEAVANRIVMQIDLPEPGPVPPGGYVVAVPASTGLKAAFYHTIRGLSLSKVQLAALLGVDEKEARRLLDPHHPSKLTRIEELLRKLGKRVVIQVKDAEETARAEPGTPAASATQMAVWNINKPPANLYKMPKPKPVAGQPDLDEIAS